MDREALQKILLSSFRQEADERLQLLADQLACWTAANTDPDQIENMFREVHSLKGAARSVGLRDTEQLCHHWESLLAEARKTPQLLNENSIELCRQTLQFVQMLSKSQEVPLQQRLQMQTDLEAAAAGQPWQLVTQQAFAGAGRVADESEPTVVTGAESDRIRVSNQSLNTLLVLSETIQQLRQETTEHHRQLQRLVQDIAAIGKLQHQTMLHERPLLSVVEQLAAVQKETLSKMLHYVAASGSSLDLLLNNSHRLQRNSARLSAELAQLSDNMSSELQSLLLVEAQVLFSGLAAMSQDLARQTGKQLQLSITDNNLHIDKRIIDELKPVLQHLVRNAIDHGIESPERRLELGKAATGQLTLSLIQQSADKFELKIADDGQGIQLQQLKNQALAKGILTAGQLSELAEDEVIALVFHSGLSTSAMLTEISGRGLGMAIVQDIIEQLGGQLNLHSVPGQGLSISILLPTSVSSFRALLIQCSDRTLALPLFAVESSLRIENTAIQYAENRATVVIGQRVVALWWLADVLQLPRLPQTAISKQNIVLMKVRGESFALVIDALLGDQDIRVKPLGPQLKKVPCVLGATLLGDGQFIAVLDPLTLFQQAQQHLYGAPAPDLSVQQQVRILVADDSFTSRALLKSILETAGYAVTTASDGQEAWNLLKQQRFEVLVSDVEMPKLDGFNLTLKVRNDPALDTLPVILVTALQSADDRQRGLEVGANAYLIKSGFEQESLLDSIRRLI